VSFHNHLKIYFWKWSRVQYGYVENVDPRWRIMLGLNEKPECVLPCLLPPRMTGVHELKQESSRNENIMSEVSEVIQKNLRISSKLSSGVLQRLSKDTLQFVSKHLTCVDALLRSEQHTPDNLVTTAVMVPTQRSIPRVIEQYKFHRKKPKLFRNSMSVQPFRNNELNRRNRVASFLMSTEGETF